MSQIPFVSILIPCYNAERWVRQSIESALAQTHPLKEVIVVDDGSTDGSLAVLRSFGEAIRVETGPNRGGNVARNQLLSLSRGEWIQFLDADDYLVPDKIERQLDVVREHPHLDVVFAPLILRTESTGKEVATVIPDKEDPFTNFLMWAGFSTISVLVRRSSIDAQGGWNESQKVCQEHELLSRLLMGGCQFGLCEHAGAIYRFHGNDTVSTRSVETTIRQRMIITDRVEGYLQRTGQLSEKRRAAIAKSRFEAARSMYFKDRTYARNLMHMARSGVPIPASPAGPRGYRMALSLLGFDAAERIGQFKRVLAKPHTPRPNGSH